MKKITGRLAEKNGQRYAVINLKSPEGKRVQKWINLNLEHKRNTETEASRRLAELLDQYNSDDMYKMEGLSHTEKERIRLANLYVEDYLKEWLESYKINISILTYDGYKKLIYNRITDYFSKRKIKLKELTGDDLNEFYIFLIQSGLKGATAQRHHSVMHRAFKQAVKRGIIPANPCDQAERPKSDKYIGEYYNAEKLKILLESLDGDPMRIVVILTIFYGLRRSEVLGIKWSAIDWKDKKIHIRHKIIENKTSGRTVLEGLDVMKTKSSCRSLPLMPYIEKILLEEKQKQQEMKNVMRSAYNKQYEEYVCVDALGNLLKPQYVTEHFKIILKQNGLEKIRFHDLRHSCASLMLANHEDMKRIQAWLGHSTITITADTYSHLEFSSKIDSADLISASLLEQNKKERAKT